MENILVPNAEKIKNFSEVGTSNHRKVKTFNQDDKEKNSMRRPLVDDVEGKKRRGTNKNRGNSATKGTGQLETSKVDVDSMPIQNNREQSPQAS